MITTIVLLVILQILFLVFYRQRRQCMQIFKEMGVPGPEPNFLFGNLLEFRKTPLFKKYQEWREMYGETFGYFEGPTPVIVTSDVNFLQEVFIKQFNKFHARKLWPVQVDPDKDEDVHLFFARGRRWKRLRNVVNPAFSAAKIKRMSPTVNDSINHLLDVIKETASSTADKSVEVLDLFRRLTLDTILRCEAGIDQNSIKDPSDPFLRHCKNVIDDTAKNPWLYLLGFMFPNLHCIWIRIYKFLHYFKFNPVFWLEDRMRDIVVMRRNDNGNKRIDLMQQMLDAQFSVNSFQELDKSTEKAQPVVRSMTNEEIVSHALLFLLAGYETTSTTLAYLFYEMSQNPQVQERLRHEVMTVLPRGYHSIEYDALNKLTYLDYVIWETLRKYPLASTVTARQCMEECVVGDLCVPAGMLVHANLWDVQYDPRHWGEDPQSFNPLRFMPERRRHRHPAAWMPFGGGPRSCAGLRFALLQLKMVVAKVLRDFEFDPPNKQIGVALTLKQGATILPENGVLLSARRRDSAMSDAGVRRGSMLSGLELIDWMNKRRESVKEEEQGEADDVDSDLEHWTKGGRAQRRKSSLSSVSEVLGQTTGLEQSKRYSMSRRGSALNSEEDEMDTSNLRRSSLSLCMSLLQADSLSKAANILRRVSVSGDVTPPIEEDCTETDVIVNNMSGKASDSNRKYMKQTTFNSSLPSCPVPVNEDEWEDKSCYMPEEILGSHPGLKSSLCRRRGSALPQLESMREASDIDEFFHRYSESLITEMTNLDDDQMLSFKKGGKRHARLYQRRGSG
ncbi:cytochrome P450 3A43 [Aplysia californica]|uniref:Cytochrome P450 3A43 n=1 Tax=Aplysia californica TaxID=6500 RepID=A0ABM1A4K0_APLCA|nr:cytochrome P450 3A43 [Aplysia californica]